MSLEFTSYALLVIALWLAALSFAGPKRAFSLSNMFGWYMVIFLTTYVLRPAFTEMSGDQFLYNWLACDRISAVWGKMTIAVCLAVICTAVGYRFGVPSAPFWRKQTGLQLSPRTYATIGILLCIWGYVTTLIVGVNGNMSVYSTNDTATGYGVAQGNTFWLMASDQFVSSGSILYSLATGRLLQSGLIAAPWILARISTGYSRIAVIGYLVALLSVHTAGHRSSPFRHLRLVIVGAAIAIFLLVFMPTIGMDRRFFADGITVDRVSEGWELARETPRIALTTSDIAGYETTLYALQSDQTLWGTYYIYFYFLKPIPRMLWPGKGFPDTLAREWLGVTPDPHAVGWAMGSIGTAFQQWSWIGIIGEFLLTGYLLRRWESLKERDGRNLLVMFMYAGFFSLLPQLGRDSLLMMIEERWLFVFGVPSLLLVALTLLKEKTAHRLVTNTIDVDRMRPAGLAPVSQVRRG